MKVLITGSNGQLGLSIKNQTGSFPSFQFIYTDVDELDITSVESLKIFFKKNKVDALINCAGYTAVDKAEAERDKAFLINAQAVKNLASLSNEFGYFLVHISTDYIFDGKKTSPYIESDSPNPLSIYGLSKFEGEKEIISLAKNAIILRTSWLYSEYGNNFVKTIQRLAKDRPELKVVSDQVGTPTYAGDLAEAILKIITHKSDFSGVNIYNYSNEGVASWFDFASAIVELDKLDCKVKPITTEEYPLPAKRPFFSVLSKEKIKKEIGLIIPDWKESLKKCIDNLKTGY
jgi:dTDP-4-dehydrorhamnose reductase